MIKSTKHTVKFANGNKKTLYFSFLKEYRKIAQIYLNHLWDHGYTWNIKDKITVLNVQNNQLDCLNYIDKTINKILPETTLSARALSSCRTQVLGCLKASIEVRRKQLYMYNKLNQEGKDTSKLEKKISKFLKKPNISNIKPELNSICCDFQEIDSFFNGFLQLKSIGKTFGKIRIPIKYHENSNKWKSLGKMKASFLFSKNHICIRWEIEKPRKKTEGLILGADQGLKDVLTLSNNTRTPKQDNHGHTLEKIINKLTRKKKGSKSFKKTQEHRKNFINWSINQLNFSNVKTIKLEKIVNIGYRKRTSRRLSHWNNPLIRDKLLNRCGELGVQVVQQSSIYRSQRCSSCGMVRKANRRSKEYSCKNCGFVCDADLNASLNHEQELPEIPINLRKLKKNLKGFFWKSSGFFELTGEEITVPSSKT